MQIFFMIFAGACVEAGAGSLRLGRMPSELQAAGGASAALTEDGYQLVATLGSNEEMGNYVRRLLAGEGKKVKDGLDDDLNGFVPYFSGAISKQSLAQLRGELDRAHWVTRASNSEVDSALDTLRNERVSSLSNASAYALAIAGALTSQDGASKTRVFVEADLEHQSTKVLAQSLKEAAEEKTQVVLQRRDGRVIVTTPQDVAMQLISRPLEKWTEKLREMRREAVDSEHTLKSHQTRQHEVIAAPVVVASVGHPAPF